MRKIVKVVAAASALLMPLSLSACGEVKADKESYTKALAEIYSFISNEGNNDEGSKLIKCLADHSYDKVSAKTVNGLVDKVLDSGNVPKEDQEILANATEDCIKEFNPDADAPAPEASESATPAPEEGSEPPATEGESSEPPAGEGESSAPEETEK